MIIMLVHNFITKIGHNFMQMWRPECWNHFCAFLVNIKLLLVAGVRGESGQSIKFG